MANIDPVVLLERVADDGGDIWESCVSAGIAAIGLLDEGRWTIGDLAHIVTKRRRYGKNALGDFAHAIGYEVDRVRDYRNTARFWQIAARAAILARCKNLHYSHFRVAMRLKDLKKATLFLHECSANDWTVEKANVTLNVRIGKPVPALKLLTGEEVCIVGIDKSLLHLDVLGLNLEANEQLMRAWKLGIPVMLKVHAAPQVEEHEQE